MAGEDWSAQEIEETVADYFVMLANDLRGNPYNKTAHRQVLMQRVMRSNGSIEFKHQNISAVLMGLGQPWITGYKPASNFQAALVDAVWQKLNHFEVPLGPYRHVTGDNRVRDEAGTLWVGPPPTFSNQPPLLDIAKITAIAQKFDVAERDARNRELGRAGEERIFAHECAVLKAAGMTELARRVRWTSQEDGDGAGYDIASFEPDGTPRQIEVKTTNGWERTPFHLTRNEVAVAEANRETWHLVRLWNFAREPQAFSIRPPLARHVELTPTSFLAQLH
ncbi:DUF3883 domain-containing protein [Sphingomonas sp. LT1P40]|uniref:DUF3883 domain-containing protein n=1 Tax=Alteristakelama amylovorans TaxID=3096166 RepID=UPI002FCB79E1